MKGWAVCCYGKIGIGPKWMVTKWKIIKIVKSSEFFNISKLEASFHH